MRAASRPTPRTGPSARHGVLQALGRSPGPITPLEVGRAAGLSSLVVVPTLAALLEEAVVTREQVTTASHGPTWTYQLTARGRREHLRRTPPGGPRPDPGAVAPLVRTRAS